eukprot:TRINITY_DN3214_c0_g1_i1.p1 TRINITY_DN3214_c0_g1~~TRINITY_DN3214_c0_g1_i1.p1  ORF type:complete len:652 (-),score=274.46 TRINITY_DN3214_c0_g1_i1:1092-3047(-)
MLQNFANLSKLGNRNLYKSNTIRNQNSFLTPKMTSAPSRKQSGIKEDPTASRLMRFEASLPSLPVPKLEQTTQKYLHTVRPLVDDAAFEKTKKAVAEFTKENGQGRELQKRLEARAAQPGMKNWIAEWWDEYAYMSYRDPVAVYSNYAYMLRDDRLRRNAPARAAALLRGVLEFRKSLESGDLEPEYSRGAPMAMTSYRMMFNSCRHPVKPNDTATKFDPKTNNHVIFMRKNKFYELEVVRGEESLSSAQMEQQIAKIIQMAGETNAKDPVGILTSENRDVWTEAREALLKADPSNENALRRIESGIIVFCLDDTKPITREEHAWGAWTGDGRNRFFDKQEFIVYENGKASYNGEHAVMDGTPTFRLNDTIGDLIASGKHDANAKWSGPLPEPKEITFKLNDSVRKYIRNAEVAFDKLRGGQDLTTLHWDSYGKELIKKFKVSPDSYVQMMMQLAYYRMHDKLGPCYESTQVRKFQLGRTEVTRSVSNEAAAFVKSFDDPNISNEKKAELLRAAAVSHNSYMNEAANGHGVDRHLLGLKKCLKDGEKLPEIYSDPSFGLSNHWVLSTSSLNSKHISNWGYGEVVTDGFGLSYSVADNQLCWMITTLRNGDSKFGSRNRSELLKAHLEDAARDMRELMESVPPPADVPRAKL